MTTTTSETKSAWIRGVSLLIEHEGHKVEINLDAYVDGVVYTDRSDGYVVDTYVDITDVAHIQVNEAVITPEFAVSPPVTYWSKVVRESETHQDNLYRAIEFSETHVSEFIDG